MHPQSHNEEQMRALVRADALMVPWTRVRAEEVHLKLEETLAEAQADA